MALKHALIGAAVTAAVGYGALVATKDLTRPYEDSAAINAYRSGSAAPLPMDARGTPADVLEVVIDKPAKVFTGNWGNSSYKGPVEKLRDSNGLPDAIFTASLLAGLGAGLLRRR